MKLPMWLQLVLGVVSIVAPELFWIRGALEIAYQIWSILPWFHKAGALVELRNEVKKAKSMKSPVPVEKWNARWETYNQTMGKYPG